MNVRSHRPKPMATVTLRLRVVTRQKNFFATLCGRTGCHEPPQASLRNAAKYCSRECRQAVRNVLDRERKWKARRGLDHRIKRAPELRTAGHERGETSRQALPGNASRAPPV